MSITYEGPTEQVRQIVHHHAVLRRGVERRARALCEAAENGVPFQRQLAILRAVPAQSGGQRPDPGHLRDRLAGGQLMEAAGISASRIAAAVRELVKD